MSSIFVFVVVVWLALVPTAETERILFNGIDRGGKLQRTLSPISGAVSRARGFPYGDGLNSPPLIHAGSPHLEHANVRGIGLVVEGKVP